MDNPILSQASDLQVNKVNRSSIGEEGKVWEG